MKTREFKLRKGIPGCIMTLFLVVFALIYTGCGKDDEVTTYTVTFDADGGSPVPSVQNVEAGKTATAPATNPTKPGYVFLFWHLSGASTAYNFSMPVNSNIILQAKWEEEANVEYWQISWELNGGAWPASGDNHATQVVKGGTLAEPTAPVKSGNTFDGWYKEAAFANKVSFPYDISSVANNFTLYAKWTTEGGSTDPSGYKMFTSISELKSWLTSQSANTAETPYKVGLKNVNLDTGNNWGDLGFAVYGTKFVDLYLLGCPTTKIPDGYYEREVIGSQIKYTYYGVFSGLNNLVSITLPKGLKTIGKYAFYKCDKIRTVIIPEGLIEIHEKAFYESSELSSVNLPEGLTSIEDNAFQYCGIASIVFPKSLKSIGLSAFSSCKFTSLTIPASFASLTNWGSSVFSDCNHLRTVVVEEGVKTIGANAFYSCRALESISMPKSLKTIEQCVFELCYPLSTITIPEGVTSIGGSAVSRCYNLSTVIMQPTTPPALGYLPFSGGGVALTIKVPAASVDAYKTADGWSSYASIIVANK